MTDLPVKSFLKNCCKRNYSVTQNRYSLQTEIHLKSLQLRQLEKYEVTSIWFCFLTINQCCRRNSDFDLTAIKVACVAHWQCISTFYAIHRAIAIVCICRRVCRSKSYHCSCQTKQGTYGLQITMHASFVTLCCHSEDDLFPYIYTQTFASRQVSIVYRARAWRQRALGWICMILSRAYFRWGLAIMSQPHHCLASAKILRWGNSVARPVAPYHVAIHHPPVACEL